MGILIGFEKKLLGKNRKIKTVQNKVYKKLLVLS